ncbi:hypothetical protein ACFSQR_11220 [Pseudoduganella sp. GCM10020061]
MVFFVHVHHVGLHMKLPPQVYRHLQIRRVRGELDRDSFPRLQMFLLVGLTGGAGFLASYLLLHAGLVQMWLRYLAALGIAYVVFLGLLWTWLRTRAADYLDVPIDVVAHGGGGGDAHACYSGQGGTFDGGGASGSYEVADAKASFIAGQGAGAPEPGAVASAGDAALEAVTEPEAIPFAVIIFFATLLFSSLFMVHSAPILFAELVVDGVLSASLYHRLRGLPPSHWLETAIARTWWPFVLTALMLVAAALWMEGQAPGAHSIGEYLLRASQAS